MVERLGVDTDWAEKTKLSYAKLLKLLDPAAKRDDSDRRGAGARRAARPHPPLPRPRTAPEPPDPAEAAARPAELRRAARSSSRRGPSSRSRCDAAQADVAWRQRLRASSPKFA